MVALVLCACAGIKQTGSPGTGGGSAGHGGGGGTTGSGSGSVSSGTGFGGTGNVSHDCVNLECQQTTCLTAKCLVPACGENQGKETTLSGTIYDPAGRLPLYNVIVYVPNTDLDPIPEGVSCQVCSGQASGHPIAAA